MPNLTYRSENAVSIYIWENGSYAIVILQETTKLTSTQCHITLKVLQI